MLASDKPHILIVKPDPDDPESLDYEVECPGVTDACREYRDCLANDSEQAALVRAMDDGQPIVAHGKRHLNIEGTWMAETDFCYVQGHDGLPDAVDGYFPVGRHAIGWDVGGGMDIEIYNIGCERCKATPAASVCCSAHGKKLCHLCYRRTHFVGVCVEGCQECAAEGLPVNLREIATVAG
jgi:hypothetical protein